MLAVRGEVLADVYGIGHRNVRGEGGSGGRAGEYHTPASGIISGDYIGAGAPTQALVDMYGMENGLPIDDPNSGYDPVSGASW